jgi:hypothetical protein
MRALAAAGVMLFHAGRAFAGEPTEPIELKAPEGIFHGLRGTGVDYFGNIAYAKPPVGELRWRYSQPETRVRQLAEPVSCPQELFGTMIGRRRLDEDCLFLNVYAPTGKGSYPVVLFIHGGGLISGTGLQKMFDGAPFARNGVVFVAINYRLGELGYGPSLESGGSLGFGDQKLALDWVRRHAALFGGDPKRIYLMGQSKGAESVVALLESGAADDGVRGGIAFSGARNFDDTPGKPAPLAFLPGEEKKAWPELQDIRGKDFLYRARVNSVRPSRGEGPRFRLLISHLYDERIQTGPVPNYCGTLGVLNGLPAYIDGYFLVLHSPDSMHGAEIMRMLTLDPFPHRVFDYALRFVTTGEPPADSFGRPFRPYREDPRAEHLFRRFSFLWPAGDADCQPPPPDSSIGPGFRFLEKVAQLLSL